VKHEVDKMSAVADRPIIIKRKKVAGGDGHHGGAWKVAYADFVTAMMAFFMLMWLLNATSEQQRAGLADYFTPTSSINRTSGGGDGMFGGDSIFSEERLSKDGMGASQLHEGAQINSATTPDEAQAGREDASLFKPGTAEPTKIAQEIGKILSNVLPVVENPLAIQAHVRAQPIVRLENTVWQLSMERATAMREVIEAGGYDPAQIMRVTGKADRQNATEDPTAVRNNRIEIIVIPEAERPRYDDFLLLERRCRRAGRQCHPARHDLGQYREFFNLWVQTGRNRLSVART